LNRSHARNGEVGQPNCKKQRKNERISITAYKYGMGIERQAFSGPTYLIAEKISQIQTHLRMRNDKTLSPK